MAERKKKHQDPETTRPEHTSVGEMLRAARLARQMEYEDVSVSIHIRPSQLRAIEENDIDSLPGMTYAVGFVRAYANFLGLNGAEIVHRFKAEHGHSSPSSKLTFPEPIVESRVPDPMMVGVGAFLAVVILVVWTVYTNVHSNGDVANEIPAAPEVASMTSATTDSPAMTPAPDTAGSALSGEALVTPAPAAASTVPAAMTPAAPEATKPADAMAVAATATPALEAKAEEPAVDAKAEAAKVEKAAKAKTEKARKENEDGEEAASSEKKSADDVINIKKGKSRITLKATQASWVQITDSHQNILYRKVLRPGEQYAVPDQPGLTLDTANAGGLDIVVDGKEVQSIGKQGEIVRGTALDPKELKIQRIKVRD